MRKLEKFGLGFFGTMILLTGLLWAMSAAPSEGGVLRTAHIEPVSCGCHWELIRVPISIEVPNTPNIPLTPEAPQVLTGPHDPTETDEIEEYNAWLIDWLIDLEHEPSQAPGNPSTQAPTTNIAWLYQDVLTWVCLTDCTDCTGVPPLCVDACTEPPATQIPEPLGSILAAMGITFALLRGRKRIAL